MALDDRSKRKILRQFEELTPEQRTAFMAEMEAHCDALVQKQAKPFPKLVKLYAHESEESIGVWELNRALGLDEQERWNPLYEIECVVEVPENPDESRIIAVDGFMIDYDRPFTREDEIVKVDR